MKILLCIDGSKLSSKTLYKALKLLDLKDKEIYLLTVIEHPELIFMEASMDQNWLETIARQQKIFATKTINLAKNYLMQNGIQISGDTILSGSPAQEIVNYAKREKMGLLVLGAHTRGEFKEFLLGSVSRRVLSECTSNVLIIKSDIT